MTAGERCPKCGARLSAGALNGLCLKCLGRLGFSPEPAGAGDSKLFRLGDYELVEEIARGGMGVVYRARQLSLNRNVAVKVVLDGPFSSAEFTRRFHTEAEAAAALRHPNIVSIHEIGEHGGRQFLSMEYIEGQSFAELVREKPLPARRAAGYLKTIAEAVQHAHQRGVLHRDLKPSNILLDVFDQPHVTDFGLAKLLHRDAELTTTGQVLGSPNHMPPEQAAGKFSEATPLSDVYSLGAILYQLLTGRPPFQGETLHEILVQVQTAEPIAPRQLNPSVPADLQTICLKCLQKEPVRRYHSAQELADELGRFLVNEPISARPVGRAERVQLWCKRRPVLAGVSAALVVAVAVGLGGVLWEWRQARQNAGDALRARERAEESARDTRLNLYAADVSLAFQVMDDDDYGLARTTLAALRSGPGETDLRGFEWRYLWNLCRGDQLATMTGHQWIITCVAFAPDGKWIVTGSQDGTAKIWDVAGRTLAATLPVANGAVWSAAFSPDGRLLMTADSDGSVKFWKTGSWQLASSIPGDIAVFSKNGSLIAVSESNPLYWEKVGKISLWDYQTGKTLKQFDGLGRSLALSPDNRKLATAGVPTGIEIWDTTTAKLVQTLATKSSIWSLDFSPDGNHLLTTDWSNKVLQWDLTGTRPPDQLSGNRLMVWSAAYSPDGSLIATAGSDQTLQLWDSETLHLKHLLHGHDNEVWCAAFSPDGKLVASGGKDQKVMLWSVDSHAMPDRLPNANTTRPILSPDGTAILTFTSTPSGLHSTLWSMRDRKPMGEVIPDEVIGFSRDGNQVASWGTDQTVLDFWSPKNQTTNRVTLLGAESSVKPFCKWGFSPESGVFFAIDGIGVVRFWESTSGRLLGSVRGPVPPVRTAILGPGGRQLALSVERENIVRLYETSTGGEMRLAGHHDFVSGLAFSPEGATLATGSVDGTIRLWDTATGSELVALPGHMEEASDVAFSPDGQTLASVCHHQSVKFWHLPTRRELFSLDFPEAGMFLQFSSDGSHLAVAGEDNTVRLFDAPSGELNATNQ